MITLFKQGGPLMWVILISTIIIIYRVVKTFIDLYGGTHYPEKRIENAINSILFWGGLAAIVGILGQLSGIYIAVNIIMKASDISPQIVMEGFAISFISTLFGLWVFFLSALLWKLLRFLLAIKNSQKS